MRHENNRKKVYLSLFIVAIMVLSTLGFIGSYTTPEQDTGYNNFEFERRGDQWVMEVDNGVEVREYSFYLHPSDIAVYLEPEIVDAVRESPDITLAFHPNLTRPEFADAARFELAKYLSEDLGKNLGSAVTMNTTRYDFPVIPCAPNATSIIIAFEPGEESDIIKNGNCISIATNNPIDYIVYVEKLIYILLGVINE